MKRIVICLALLSLLTAAAPAANPGQWEVGAHFSYWSIDVIAPLVEDVTPDLKYYDPAKGAFSFDSNGNNMGLEFRFFPGGKEGSFSVGISYERNNFKASMSGAYTDSDNYGNKLEAGARGAVELVPHSFNLSLRWELAPRSRVHPYIGLGFGFGALKGAIDFRSETTVFYSNGSTQTETEDESWTLKEAIEEYEQEEGKSFPLGFFPIVHLNFGLRAEIGSNLYLLGEFALYDGLIFRGGLAYRF